MNGDGTDPRGVRIPEDLETVLRPVAPDAPAASLRLVVIEGPDAGKTFTLDPNMPSRVLIGTSPACEIRVSDPTVSRRHAGIEPFGRRFKISDFDSTNGTFVDGVAIIEAFLRGGEIVRLGSTAMQVESAQGQESTPLPSAMRFGLVIGASVAMRRLYPLCERLAKARVPVVIEGETGTGKENLAESLHEASGITGPFVVFDCTTVSPSLVEAELFGHEKGAFTGAIASRAGVFEQADGGTLLIDEIGDLDLPLQAKLLRAIDRGEIRRVGGQKQITVTVRILAATRRDLDKEVAAGRFRDDLFHRLTVARIELPPLRERHGDIPLLARHFCEHMGASPEVLTAAVMARFEASTWPGNVRELRNAVARVVALGEDEDVLAGLSVKGQPQSSRTGAPPAPGADWMDALCSGTMPFPLARRRAVQEFERRYVQNVLAQHDGNVARAAQASGIALRYFQLVKARGKKDGS